MKPKIDEMPASPLITIVITSYNYGSYLPRAIESALQQGSDELEVVVVDNCSTDDSWETIQRFAKRDARIKPHLNERNLGLVGNHMRGLSLASGEKVLFLSADDCLLPGHVKRVLATHLAHPEIDLVFSTYFQVDEHDKITRYLDHPGHLRGSYYGGRNEFAGLLTYDCYTCLPTTLFDRVELIEAGGFDENLLAMDLDLYLRFAALGKQMAFIDSPGVCIRVHSEAASGKDRYVASGKQLREHLYLLERYLDPKYAHLLRGHENGVARLLQAKINNIHAYPSAAEIIPVEQERIGNITARLGELLNETRSMPLPRDPLVSVIVVVRDDVNRSIEMLRRLAEQTYPHWETVVSVDAPYSAGPMIARYAQAATLIDHRIPTAQSASLNDAMRLASGEIFAFLAPEVVWPPNHLERIVNAMRDSRIDAICVAADFTFTREGVDHATFPKFFGGNLAETGARIGEATPLPTLALRRRRLDATGHFEEGLKYLIDFEWMQRVLSAGALGVVDSDPITVRAPIEVLHQALLEPNGYMSSLRTIYNGRPVGEPWASMREAHFAKLTRELHALGANTEPSRAHYFWRAALGAAPYTVRNQANRSRPRVLVIDDCVPYNELGRGYPRARAMIETLRDAGFDVIFYPLVHPVDTEPLTHGISGVELLYNRGGELLALTLDELLPKIDLLWVSRPHNMRDVQAALQYLEQTAPPIVYDAEAVYVERDRISGELHGNPLEPLEYERLLARELSYCDGCAVVSAVSKAEGNLIGTRFSGPIEVISFSIDAAPTAASFEERNGLLFVGAIEEHSPNDDALTWFMSEVAPLVPDMPVRQAGVNKSPTLQDPPLQLLGMVPDLTSVYNESRIFIAPTRFAAGLPQKVYEAAAHGLPAIISPLLADQLRWAHEVEVLVAQSPQEWQEAIERLDTDKDLWHRLRANALRRVEAEVSPVALRASVERCARLALDLGRQQSAQRA